jgi:thiol:disulfide interchange protein
MNKITLKHIFGAVILILLQACHSTQVTNSNSDNGTIVVPNENPLKTIVFQTPVDFEVVLAKAKAQKKPVFLDFSAKWCAPCKLMEKNVFTDERVAQFFNEHFICYKADADTDPNGNIMNLNYNITSYPAMIFLDPDGNEIIREIGTVGRDRLLELGRIASN